MRNKVNLKGFTLIEMILVLVIISTMVLMSIRYFQRRALEIRITKTVQEIQTILQASKTYYMKNNTWPTTWSDLLNSGTYLTGLKIDPNTNTPINPFFGHYTFNSTNHLFGIVADINNDTYSTSTAENISGRLPSGAAIDSVALTGNACDPLATTCYVATSINIPMQNLNKATHVTFANLYHNGACVPAPECPVDKNGNTMVQEITVVPASVSGVNDQTNPQNIYPLSSFTAYATALTQTSPGFGPPACGSDTGTNTACYSDAQGGKELAPGKYWRVCLEVITQKGKVAWGTDTSATNWGKYATILVVTRCDIRNVTAGSSFNVWAP